MILSSLVGAVENVRSSAPPGPKQFAINRMPRMVTPRLIGAIFTWFLISFRKGCGEQFWRGSVKNSGGGLKNSGEGLKYCEGKLKKYRGGKMLGNG